MAVRVEKAKNSDGYCTSCLDNKGHKRLYHVRIDTYGMHFHFHLCEHCAKELRDGINSPEDRPKEEDVYKRQQPSEKKKKQFSELERKVNAEKVRRQRYTESNDGWPEEEE